jgi:gas vesicle protein
MGQTPDEIRHEIEKTRNEMSDTASALGYKANVPARTKGWVADKKDAVVSAVAGTKDTVTSTLSDATPDGEQIKASGRRAVGIAESNPLGLAIAGAAVGFVAGIFTPSTKLENEKLGPMSDQVKQSAAEAGQEAIEHGKEVAKATAHSAADTARQQGREHGEELQSSLNEKVQEVSPAQN